MASRARYQKILRVLRQRQLDLTVVMDNVQKPHNLAAIARSCDAAGVSEIHAVVASGNAVRLPHDTAGGVRAWLQVSAYSHLSTAISALRKRGFCLAAASVTEDACDYRNYNFNQPTAILLGAELEGLSAEARADADVQLTIPLAGMGTSLNVSVAAALMLFEAKRQREARGSYQVNQLSEAEIHKISFEWLYPKVADYYQRHNLIYPLLDEEGAIINCTAYKPRK